MHDQIYRKWTWPDPIDGGNNCLIVFNHSSVVGSISNKYWLLPTSILYFQLSPSKALKGV